MCSACADQALADACISGGAEFCHVERIRDLAHASVLLRVVYLMQLQLQLQRVTLFHAVAAAASDPVSWHYYPSATGRDELLVHTALAKDLLTVTQVQVSVPQEVS
jgi:hypothetical protein